MALDTLNWCPKATVVLHDGVELSDERKSELKAIYLEGFIRFLNIYAQTEIGEGFELDITKIGLFVNSSRFENDDLYCYSSIDDIFRLCEILVLQGLPIWRFLKLDVWNEEMLEKSYKRLLTATKKKAATISPCYDCIWYSELDTFLGVLRRCVKPSFRCNWEKQSSYDPNSVKECEWQTTLTKIPEAVESLSLLNRKQFENSIPEARKRFQKKLEEDPFRLPRNLSEKESVDLNTQYDALLDFACVCRNERSKSEMQYDIRKAMCVEGMIRFFEMYAKCELGSDYIADVKNISLWVDDYDRKSDINAITSYEDMYCILECMILEDSIQVMNFVKGMRQEWRSEKAW